MSVRWVCAVVTLVALACGCASDNPDRRATPSSATTAGASGEVQTGVEMTVTGQVSRLVDAHLFVIGDNGSDALLVLVPTSRSSVRQGATVEVTGAVRRLAIRAVEEEFGIDLDDRRVGPFEGEPTLLATRLETRD